MNTLHLLRSSVIATSLVAVALVAGCAAPEDEATDDITDSDSDADSEDVGSSEAAASNGSPRIDLYLTSGNGRSQPCTRTASGSKRTYYCRDLKTIKATTVYPRAHWSQPKGDVSGGNNLIAQDSNGTIWEACVATAPKAKKVSCTAKANNVAAQVYGSGSDWYTRAAKGVLAQLACGQAILDAVKSLNPENIDISSCVRL